MPRFLILSLLTLFLMGCANASLPTIAAGTPSQAEEFAETLTATLPTTAPLTFTPSPLPPTETPSATPTATALPVVESLKATVVADKLSCRYGPGANYLYLIAFNKATPLTLIGRALGNDWVLVENGPQDCWVKASFLEVPTGNPQNLRPMYPDGFKIPVSPYYGATTVLEARRDGEKVIVSWIEIVVSPGKYEDEDMFPYIVEVWSCQGGEIVFETLGSRVPFVSFIDQAGCSEPSHGRVYIQEKHGYGGPAEIPWPEKP